ncbi:hypothetical protein [Streptomyces acidiscabies]|uniref:DUF58 domain-containing protein n=1 Tax=Streptomyces acidiscabies TaxID=42234 RepID=A0ABU4MF22_9ACTN|nr:hypothetical protein [Streptomyces acidiscabies]MDX3025710.1 hypothetical protein [Streptomyces acidiscabies]
MLLPVIAIIISVASALFTAINVGISYANYKRVRPRIHVEAEFEWDESRGLLEMGIRIINRGQTPTKVSREVHLLFLPTHLVPRKLWFLTPWKLLFAKGPHGWGWYVRRVVSEGDPLEFTANDVFPTDLPPFGSVEWEHTFRLEELRKEIGEDRFRGERLSVLVAVPQFLAVMASSGFRKLPPTPTRLMQVVSQPVIQLSFDDLEEAEG